MEQVSRRKRFFAMPVWKKLAVLALLGIVGLLAFSVATYSYYARDISDPNRLMNRNNTGLMLMDNDGDPYYRRGFTKYSGAVPLDKISPHVVKALIATEEKDFYSNPGFSLKGILRAVYSNASNGDLTRYGGSTITQQLVKNNLLSSSKNFLRKYQEISMAVAIERRYSKDQILEMYLNSVYFGEGAFGIKDAAHTYFGKEPAKLNLAESSQLIALLPAPSAYSPVSGDKQAAKKYQEYVLTRMAAEKQISPEEKQSALTRKLSYRPRQAAKNDNAHHFSLMVIDELNKRYGEERVTRSGFRVITTLDAKRQKLAERTMKQHIATLAPQHVTNGSLVAIDTATGEVKAFVGSADWYNQRFGKINMATSPRQPGSSFKPLYYAKAIDERKITAATVLKDEPMTFEDGYRPQNYDFRFRGDVTVRYALANSLNIPSIQVMQKIGVDDAVSTAQNLGIETVNQPQKYGLSLALGTAEARLLDMTNAYAALANKGEQFTPAVISRIEDKFGKTIYEYEPEAKEVFSQEAAYVMSSILSDEKARAPLLGDRFSMGRPLAVKTGTTDDYRDAWTMGYTPSIAVGAWIGNSNSRPMAGVPGSYGAGPVWRAVVQSFSANSQAEKFEQPDGVTKNFVCTRTLSGNYEEFFIKGTELKNSCFVAKPKPKKNEARDEKEKEKKDRKEDKRDGQGEGGDEESGDEEETEEAPPEPPPEEEEPPAEPPEGDSSGPG